MMNNNPSPRLQPPGAGLPWIELRIARLMVGWQRRRTSRAASAELFASQRLRLVELVGCVPVSDAARPVLIRRPPGLEDSSRFYSLFMVLDHLRRVNDSIAETIEVLIAGRLPTLPSSTADVKPSPGAGPESVARFEASCDAYERLVTPVADLHTDLRWPHPWFGPLDAHAWHFFAAMHMRLHEGQAKTIRSALQRDAVQPDAVQRDAVQNDTVLRDTGTPAAANGQPAQQVATGSGV